MQNRKNEKEILLQTENSRQTQTDVDLYDFGLIASGIVGSNTAEGLSLAIGHCAPTVSPALSIGVGAAGGLFVGLVGIGLTLFCCPSVNSNDIAAENAKPIQRRMEK